jgi:hypothetical protein
MNLPNTKNINKNLEVLAQVQVAAVHHPHLQVSEEAEEAQMEEGLEIKICQFYKNSVE